MNQIGMEEMEKMGEQNHSNEKIKIDLGQIEQKMKQTDSIMIQDNT